MPNRLFRPFAGILAAFWMFAVGIGIQAAPPRANLVEYVTDDAGLCVELLGLQQKVATFLQSEFAHRLQASPLYLEWQAGNDYQRLREAADAIELVTGEPPAEAIGALFGKQTVLALFPVEGAFPEWVLLSEAAPEDAIKRFDLWARLEERQVTQLSHAGIDYTRSEKRGQFVYYTVTDTFFAVTTSESRLQAIITQNAARDKRPVDGTAGLSARAEYQQLREQLHADTAAVLFTDPHRWPDWQNKLTGDIPQLDPLSERVRALAVGWRMDHGLGAEVAISWNDRDLPAPWKQLVGTAMQRPKIVERVPANMVLLMTGRSALGDFLRLAVANMPDHERQELPERRRVLRGLLLGWDAADHLLPRLGQEWIAYMTAPESTPDGAGGSAAPRHADLVAALEVDLAEPADKTSPMVNGSSPAGSLAEGVDNTLDVGLNLLAAGFNAKNPDGPTAVVRSQRQDNVSIRWVDSVNLGEGIREIRPAAAVASQGVVLATSPEAAVDFINGSDERRFVQVPELKTIAEDRFPGASQLLLIRGRALAEILPATVHLWAGVLGKTDEKDLKRADRGASELSDMLQISDWIYFATAAKPGLLRVTFGGMTSPSGAN